VEEVEMVEFLQMKAEMENWISTNFGLGGFGGKRFRSWNGFRKKPILVQMLLLAKLAKLELMVPPQMILEFRSCLFKRLGSWRFAPGNSEDGTDGTHGHGGGGGGGAGSTPGSSGSNGATGRIGGGRRSRWSSWHRWHCWNAVLADLSLWY